MYPNNRYPKKPKFMDEAHKQKYDLFASKEDKPAVQMYFVNEKDPVHKQRFFAVRVIHYPDDASPPRISEGKVFENQKQIHLTVARVAAMLAERQNQNPRIKARHDCDEIGDLAYEAFTELCRKIREQDGGNHVAQRG